MRKRSSIAFIVLAAALLLAPLLFLDRAPESVSPADNRVLAALPATLEEAVSTGEAALSDRVGFREGMIAAYQEIGRRLFHTLAHPSYIYGQEGEVFYKLGYYVRDFQRLDTDDDCIRENPPTFAAIRAYLSERDCSFFFVLVPDKKTVYEDLYPRSVRAKEGPSRTEVYLAAMEEASVPVIYLRDALSQARAEGVRVYYKAYDPGHWNEAGAFRGHSAVLAAMRESIPEIPLPREGDYRVTYAERATVHASYLRISETVPEYTLRRRHYRDVTEEYEDALDHEGALTVTEYPDAPVQKTLLIVHDSYFLSSEKYYSEIFSRVMYIRESNLPELERFVNAVDPDVVLFEQCERVMQWSYPREEVRLAPMAETASAEESACVLRWDGGAISARDGRLVSLSGTAPPGGRALFLEGRQRRFAAAYDAKSGAFRLCVARSALEGMSAAAFVLIDGQGMALRCDPVPIAWEEAGAFETELRLPAEENDYHYAVLAGGLAAGETYVVSMDSLTVEEGAIAWVELSLYDFAADTVLERALIEAGEEPEETAFLVPEGAGDARLLLYAGEPGATSGVAVVARNPLVRRLGVVLRLPAEGNDFHYAVLAEDLEAGERCLVSMDSLTLEKGSAQGAVIALYDFTTDSTLAARQAQFGDGRQEFAFTVPDGEHDVRLLLYAGEPGATGGVGLVATNVSVERMPAQDRR